MSSVREGVKPISMRNLIRQLKQIMDVIVNYAELLLDAKVILKEINKGTRFFIKVQHFLVRGILEILFVCIG